MNFRIADTFTDSLARLTGDEQKAVKTTVFDLQVNAASPGFSFHKLAKAKDRNFWSVQPTILQFCITYGCHRHRMSIIFMNGWQASIQQKIVDPEAKAEFREALYTWTRQVIGNGGLLYSVVQNCGLKLTNWCRGIVKLQ
jgi:hypothetical protein